MGISTEYWAIPVFDRHLGELERVIQLLRAPGNGPFSLRVGGDSADHAVFDVDLSRTPRGIVDLDPDWFHQMGTLVRATAARLILDLNLVTDLPRMAGQWADAAIDELPSHSVSGFEIGNEPDLYSHRYWSSVFARIAPLARDLPLQLAPDRYVELFRAYGHVLARLAPNMPLFGPVTAYPIAHPAWIVELLEGPHPGLRMVTAHEYPYSACATPLSRAYPTVAKLLSEESTAGVAARLRRSIKLAHRAGFAFRLTELNSVTCGGTAGVSNTFATALWAPDMLFELLRAGASGVNIHVRAYAVNAPFALTDRGIDARPLLYGLITFARMLGRDARLVVVHLREERPVHVTAWAVEISGDILHVLLINKGERAVTTRLALPATGAASVQRLLAPSVTAESGVTLGGKHLAPTGAWVGRASIQSVMPVDRRYQLSLPATSAALLSVRA